MEREIDPAAWTRLAASLDIDEAALRAVAEVEANGRGFLPAPSTRPKVLFEGHAFHRLTGGRYDRSHPELSYRTWSRRKYAGSLAGEWRRLDAACKLDRAAALQSASWGLFQIMGFNYAVCGFGDIEAFVAAQSAGAESQLQAFAAYISRPPFPALLRGHRWAGFARAYNGPGYARHGYDKKLAAAYARHAKAADTAPAPEAALPPGRSEFAPPATTRKRAQGRSVKPDAIDLRDWLYRPSIAVRPDGALFPRDLRPVKQQGRSNACTGFALSTVIEYLLLRAGRPVEALSGYMLYSMARRYDEWAEDEDEDSGSSLRGALKGWSRHGASRERLWKRPAMPRATNDPASDWWLDAVQRPMGAYYRLSLDAIGDIHVALAEAGVVYASASTHAGWDKLMAAGETAPPAELSQLPAIEHRRGDPDQGHAFAIVGYTPEGFIVQNSWGPGWGRGGYGVLRYADWLQNAMDCWVVQLGVVTDEHAQAARSASLRLSPGTGRVQMPASPTLALRQIDPFVLDMENEGRLSTTGRFRTSEDDLRALVEDHLPAFRRQHGMAANEKVDIALYAHGGLNDEKAAEQAARDWIPWLYQNRIFPVFLMWETGALKTLANIAEDAVKGEQEHVVGGALKDLWQRFRDWGDRRLEALLRKPGRKLWEEMKQNADAASSAREAGLLKLLGQLQAGDGGALPSRLRLHLVGHSAGAILHTHLMPRALAAGFDVASLSLLAPAVSTESFDRKLGATLVARRTRVLVAHLTDNAEAADSCAAIYGHSLLYLVSRSFETAADTPILGMEKYLLPSLASHAWGAGVTRLASPEFACPADPAKRTAARTHGSVDDDRAVRWAVVRNIQGLPI